jgi:hypothetical protein
MFRRFIQTPISQQQPLPCRSTQFTQCLIPRSLYFAMLFTNAGIKSYFFQTIGAIWLVFFNLNRLSNNLSIPIRRFALRANNWLNRFSQNPFMLTSLTGSFIDFHKSIIHNRYNLSTIPMLITRSQLKAEWDKVKK